MAEQSGQATMSNNLLPRAAGVDEATEKQFGGIDVSAIKFPDTWVFWESMKQDKYDKSSQSDSFIDNNYQLFEFNDMETLAKIWRTKIGNVSFFFTFDNQSVKFQDKNTRFRQNEAICFFKKGIQPAWEDPKNSHGGEFQILLENIDNKQEIVNKIFRDTIVTILSEEYPFLAETNGVRLVDKPREGHAKIRLEIWMSFADDRSETNTRKINQLIQLFSQVFQKHFSNKSGLVYKNHQY